MCVWNTEVRGESVVSEQGSDCSSSSRLSTCITHQIAPRSTQGVAESAQSLHTSLATRYRLYCCCSGARCVTAALFTPSCICRFTAALALLLFTSTDRLRRHESIQPFGCSSFHFRCSCFCQCTCTCRFADARLHPSALQGIRPTVQRRLRHSQLSHIQLRF